MWLYRYFSGKQRQSQYKLMKEIGRGNFGIVYKCILHEHMDVECAAKVIELKGTDEKNLEQIRMEIEIWSDMRNMHVVKLLKVITDEKLGRVILFSELMDENMKERHRRMARLGSKPRLHTILISALQISRAMEYIHDLQIVHRDLKSENVFITKETFKVGDMGLSRRVGRCMTAETGSYRWMAPEVIRHEEYGTSCDVYSFGILLYEMLTLTVPFSRMSTYQVILAVARHNTRPELPPGLPKDVRELVCECWHEHAEERPCFPELTKRIEVIIEKKMSFGAMQMCGVSMPDRVRFDL